MMSEIQTSVVMNINGGSASRGQGVRVVQLVLRMQCVVNIVVVWI
jgi:hypothetical protein